MKVVQDNDLNQSIDLLSNISTTAEFYSKRSRLASLKTNIGSLPPSSSTRCLKLDVQIFIIFLPMVVLPLIATIFILSDLIS